MKNLEINEKVRMEVITIEELLDNIATGKICLPEYQRPVVWSDDQCKLLADTVKHGYPYGVLSLAEITSENGETKCLLIDGHQRRSALEKNVKWYDEKIDSLLLASDEMAKAGKMEEVAKLEDDIKKAETDKMGFLSSEVVLEVAKLSIPEAAQMFVRLNNGKALSGIQKGTAKIDSKTLAKARQYINLLPVKVAGKKCKDEIALMLAAALVKHGTYDYNCKNMATAGSTAIRVLELADATMFPDAAKLEEAAKAFNAAVVKAARESEWFAAARLVPAVAAGYIFHITEDMWSAMFQNLDKVNSYACRTHLPATVKIIKCVKCYNVNYCNTKEAAKFVNIWQEPSNSPKATLARFSSLRDVFRPTPDRLKGWHPLVNAGIAPVEENAEELEETANAMAEMFNA
nr:MAG TPA: Protein of unknown function DUF262 [Bacteriophage sp.]